MRHYSTDEWTQFVKNEITESARIELEDHLYSCDQCLELYLQAIAIHESSLPLLTDETGFADEIMASLPKMAAPVAMQNDEIEMVPEKQEAVKKPKRFYQRAAFHYLLAAAATLLLTFSGAFQTLAKYADSFETQHVQEKKPSVTEGVMNKTFAWMDSLEKKEANKK
ncbi:anti-sigma factor [Neobacillus sp. Marseille-QA0830]